MITIIQIISVIFALQMLYIIHLHKKKKLLDKHESNIWILIWISFIYIALFPQTFTGVIQSLQIARVFDLVVILAFMVITILTFYNRISVKDMSKKLEDIVRKRTLYEKKKSSKN